MLAIHLEYNHIEDCTCRAMSLAFRRNSLCTTSRIPVSTISAERRMGSRRCQSHESFFLPKRQIKPYPECNSQNI